MSYESYRVRREMPRKQKGGSVVLGIPRASLWRRVWGELKAIGRGLFFRSYL